MKTPKYIKQVADDKTLWSIDSDYYLVSKIEWPQADSGYETMIFRADAEGNVEDYMDLYCTRYDETPETSINNFMKGME
tara:strand:- start:145 stop:381 length:237 start_codon:yes stop_codon:yes gene_type:complete